MCEAERRTHVMGAGLGCWGGHVHLLRQKCQVPEHHMGTGTVDMSCVTLSHALSRGSHFYWHIRSSKILLLIHHKGRIK